MNQPNKLIVFIIALMLVVVGQHFYWSGKADLLKLQAAHAYNEAGDAYMSLAECRSIKGQTNREDVYALYTATVEDSHK